MEEKQEREEAREVQRIENIVEIDDGKMFTTSLTIAKAFGKEHKNVLRDIENLECSSEFRQLNFELCNYSSELSPDGRKYPYYQITRDGFAFLAMGFTGKKAAAWKEKFLEESIEEALNADTELGLPNAASLEAMEDAKNGVGPVYETVNECLDALNVQAKKLADDPHEKKVLDWIEKVSDYEGWKA